MKRPLILLAATLAALSPLVTPAAAMCGDKPKAQTEGGCCCCGKMQKPAASQTVEQLLDAVKEAKGDQRLDALAAVITKLVEERKTGAPSTSPSAPAAAEGHQH